MYKLSEFSYAVAMTSNSFLVFLSIYYVFIFNDFKTDGTDLLKLCKSLNSFVLPEYVLYFGFNIFFLFGGQWIPVAFNLPLMAYHITKYQNRPIMSALYLYDPKTITNADNLYTYRCESYIKLAFYLFSYFYYLYKMVQILKRLVLMENSGIGFEK